MKFKFFRRAGALLLALILAFSLVPAAGAADGDLTSLRVTSEESSLAVGEDTKVTANLTFNTSIDFTEVEWTIDDPSVGSLSESKQTATANNGTATLEVTFEAQNAGTAKITVTGGGQTDSCTITVTDPPDTDPKDLKSLTITSDEDSLEVGEEATITVELVFSTGVTSTEVKWTIDNPAVGYLYSPPQEETRKTTLEATFVARKAGKAKITVTGGGQTDSCTITVTAPPPVTAASVAVTPTTLSLYVGGKKTVKAEVTMSNNKKNADVTWSSSDADVATVNANSGEVTAKAAGTATVTATSKAKNADGDTVSAGCVVTVTEAPVVAVTGVTISGSDRRTIGLDEGLTLTAVVQPATATNQAVTWDSSDTTVAVVNDGVVTPKAVGTTTITVTTADGGKTATCTVEVKRVTKPVTGVRIEPAGLVVQSKQGKTLSLEREGQREIPTVTVLPADAENKSVTWTSSDEKVAVTENGAITAKGPGTATVTVTSDANPNAVDRCQVTVSGIILSESAVTVKVGQTATVTATGYGRASGRLVWTSDDPTVASGSGSQIVGLSIGKTTIRIAAPGTSYEKRVEVTVEENTVRFDSSVNAGEVLYFSTLLSQLNKASQDGTTGKADLKSISSVTVATKEGIIHYGYLSPDVPNHGVGGSETYYVSPNTVKGEEGIDDLKYVPAGGFSGTAIISYVGRSAKDETFNGTIYVDVKDSGDVTYSTAMGRALTLSAKTFKDVCQLKTGRNASYVTFTQPSGNKGTLYYNYTPSQYSPKVDSATKYYLSSSPSLEKVTFVPAENFIGKVTVPYRCTDTTGGGYSGTMTINIYSASGESSGGVEYETGINQRVTLNASDFDDACLEESGRSLSYIYFDELPPAAQGVLYYNYTSASSNRVDTTTRYNRGNTSPRISSVTFVPASNFSGTVTIPYTGWDAAGQSYKDNLVIRVSDAAGTVYYTTGVDDPVTFRAEDFNEACQKANGSTLNYIRFTLPSSSVGTLYRNYRSGSNTGTRLSSSTLVYRGGTPSVSDVTFVPKSRYEGTVSIPFSGQDAGGAEFAGTVSITVGQGTGRVVRYSTASGGVVRFSAGDFNAVSRSATGDDLSYLSFEPPASRYGTLYYQYNASRGTGTQVTSSGSYYRSGGSRALDDVSFASANINGIASFQFTARSTGGERFTGTVEIAIGSAGLDTGSSSGTRYIGSSAPIVLRTADFEYACQSALGGALSHIRFTSLPAESAGRLYMNYESPSRPGAPATTSSNYTTSSGLTIGQLSFVPKAGYQGQVNIPYTGYNAQGGSFSGNVTIDISTGYCATPFYDVDGGWEWARPSVEFLRYAGVTNGYSDGSFRPSRSISRGEFTLMVCRAFGFETDARVSSFPDVPADSPYAGAVATARSMGIVEGSGGRFRPDSAITRQSAMTIIYRAMKAAGVRVPATGTSVLNAYSDQARIASHARDSVAALVNLGVVRGSDDMRLNPTRSITRAEMAVILHRVLTL